MEEVIQRIPQQYVGENCAQLTIQYKNTLTRFDEYSILYHHNLDSDQYINNYTTDERNKQFPYHNIPIYYSKKGFLKYNSTNQLYDFEKTYIEIIDNKLLERVVVKDKENALVITKQLLSTKKDIPYIDTKISTMTRKEFDKLFEQPINSKEKVYIMNLKGILFSNNFAYKSELEFANTIKQKITREIEQYKERVFETNESYHYFDEYTIKYFENCLNNFNQNLLPSSILEESLIIKINGSNISIRIVSPKFIKPDCYIVTTYNIPITKYTLEQIKFLATKISTIKEPKIPLRLNPSITKEEIKKAKEFTKIKTKKL